MGERTGWEHYELEGEMSGANIATLLELFKREHEEYMGMCMEYVYAKSKLTEEAFRELEEACKLKNEGRQKLAMRIAEVLTNTKLKI